METAMQSSSTEHNLVENDSLLERYKYILAQKQALNKTSFRVASIFQTLYIGMVTVALQTVKSAYQRFIPPEAAREGLMALSVASLVIACFCVFLLVSGISSWIKYRRDEFNVEQAVGIESRPLPQWKDAFRWYESYLILGVIGTCATCIIGIWCYAIPQVIAIS